MGGGYFRAGQTIRNPYYLFVVVNDVVKAGKPFRRALGVSPPHFLEATAADQRAGKRGAGVVVPAGDAGAGGGAGTDAAQSRIGGRSFPHFGAGGVLGSWAVPERGGTKLRRRPFYRTDVARAASLDLLDTPVYPTFDLGGTVTKVEVVVPPYSARSLLKMERLTVALERRFRREDFVERDPKKRQNELVALCSSQKLAFSHTKATIRNLSTQDGAMGRVMVARYPLKPNANGHFAFHIRVNEVYDYVPARHDDNVEGIGIGVCEGPPTTAKDASKCRELTEYPRRCCFGGYDGIFYNTQTKEFDEWFLSREDREGGGAGGGFVTRNVAPQTGSGTTPVVGGSMQGSARGAGAAAPATASAAKPPSLPPLNLEGTRSYRLPSPGGHPHIKSRVPSSYHDHPTSVSGDHDSSRIVLIEEKVQSVQCYRAAVPPCKCVYVCGRVDHITVVQDRVFIIFTGIQKEGEHAMPVPPRAAPRPAGGTKRRGSYLQDLQVAGKAAEIQADMAAGRSHPSGGHQHGHLYRGADHPTQQDRADSPAHKPGKVDKPKEPLEQLKLNWMRLQIGDVVTCFLHSVRGIMELWVNYDRVVCLERDKWVKHLRKSHTYSNPIRMGTTMRTHFKIGWKNTKLGVLIQSLGLSTIKMCGEGRY